MSNYNMVEDLAYLKMRVAELRLELCLRDEKLRMHREIIDDCMFCHEESMTRTNYGEK